MKYMQLCKVKYYGSKSKFLYTIEDGLGVRVKKFFSVNNSLNTEEQIERDLLELGYNVKTISEDKTQYYITVKKIENN